jgi:hypothetical protein
VRRRGRSGARGGGAERTKPSRKPAFIYTRRPPRARAPLLCCCCVRPPRVLLRDMR